MEVPAKARSWDVAVGQGQRRDILKYGAMPRSRSRVHTRAGRSVSLSLGREDAVGRAGRGVGVYVSCSWAPKSKAGAGADCFFCAIWRGVGEWVSGWCPLWSVWGQAGKARQGRRD